MAVRTQALFFHCNLLHKSDQNHSESPRWSLICCFVSTRQELPRGRLCQTPNEAFAQNAARNEPFEEDVHHPSYTPLIRLPDGELAAIGRAQLKALGATQPRL